MKKSAFALLISGLFCSCNVPYELSQRNLSQLYELSEQFTHPEYLILHNNDSLSTLYLKLELSHFIYVRSDITGTYACNIDISYTLRKSYEQMELIDSSNISLRDSANYQIEKQIIQEIQIPLSYPGEYLMSIYVTDINRGQTAELHFNLYKENRNSQQYFLALSGLDETPVFSKYIDTVSKIHIYSSQLEEGKLFGRYYEREFPIALPPFAADLSEPFNYQSDSNFVMELKDHRTPDFFLPRRGFYHFQTDTSDKEGFTLFVFDEAYPMVSSASQILEPLRYLTTQTEYKMLADQKNVKLAVDSFWLDNAGNLQRAKSQIAKYYSRVQEANKLFFSYLEGWKTDRGIVYLIFGPPNNVYRGTNTESWVYGEPGNSHSLRFSFVRVNNPFTYNDYSLYRNPMYKEAWYNAVENWRR